MNLRRLADRQVLNRYLNQILVVPVGDEVIRPNLPLTLSLPLPLGFSFYASNFTMAPVLVMSETQPITLPLPSHENVSGPWA